MFLLIVVVAAVTLAALAVLLVSLVLHATVQARPPHARRPHRAGRAVRTGLSRAPFAVGPHRTHENAGHAVILSDVPATAVRLALRLTQLQLAKFGLSEVFTIGGTTTEGYTLRNLDREEYGMTPPWQQGSG